MERERRKDGEQKRLGERAQSTLTARVRDERGGGERVFLYCSSVYAWHYGIGHSGAG